MRRRTGPVQQWVDSIPSPTTSSPSKLIEAKDISNTSTPSVLCVLSKELTKQTEELKQTTMTASTPIAVPNSPATTLSAPSNPFPQHRLIRDPSLQSDSSHCSSVESFLEQRKADPEAVLLNLGFGGYPSSPQENGPLSRIPKRFLQPSKLKGIAINDFMKQQQETNESLDTASLGYRGLTGSPYVAPSEIVQKIMERLREHESQEIETHSYNVGIEQNIQEGRLSVLSPDNRQFLDQPRAKSPDMRNKRMIIGQRSFAFGCDGDLIEIDSKPSKINSSNPADVIKSDDPKNQLDNQNINKIIKPQNRRYSLNDNSHHQASSSDINLDDKNIFNAKKLFTTEHKELKTENKKQQSIIDDNHNLPNVSRQLSECLPEFQNRSMTFEEGRRSSGGTTFSDGSGDTVIPNRKRSLKRQAKIRDEFESFDSNATIENDEYPDSVDLNTEAIVKSRQNPLQLVTNIRDRVCEKVSEMEETLNMDLEDVCESESDTNSRASDDDNNYVEDDNDKDGNDNDNDNDDNNTKKCEEATGDSQCCSENHQLCCQSDKLGQICKHDANHTGCCYHESSERCWRKMEKIMEKNKKLEKMVVKSKRGIVEIREMLSSVLSVRMEPGF
ncbi:uncharacterized protein DDB_G0286591 isoform X2 [Leptopilina heterotoma]|nr:uncharacterized protein DDB_G0286591 isoform X2 [Leptopilina heterotoma]